MFLNESVKSSTEILYNEGMFVYLSPSEKFLEDYKEFCNVSKITNLLKPADIHQTFIYAKEQFNPDLLKDIRKGLNPRLKMKYNISGLYLEKFLDNKGKWIILLKFSSPSLVHTQRMTCEKYHLKHSFPELMLHMTFSYEVDGNIDDLNLDHENILLTRIFNRNAEYSLVDMNVSPVNSHKSSIIKECALFESDDPLMEMVDYERQLV